MSDLVQAANALIDGLSDGWTETHFGDTVCVAGTCQSYGNGDPHRADCPFRQTIEALRQGGWRA